MNPTGDGCITKERIRDLRRRHSRGLEALVQAAKAALAAVLALLAGIGLGGAPLFLAPYAAVLAVTSTVRRSWSAAVRQAAMLVIGVVLAYGGGLLVPDPTAALGLLVVVGLLLGRWRRFGDDGEWIAVTALLLTVNGTAHHPTDLVVWIVLSVVGSAIGATVNTIVLPPLHVRDGHDAVWSLSGAIAQHLRAMAAGVREGWNSTDAVGWVAGARKVRADVRQADDAVWFGRESVRWNPRHRSIRHPEARLAVPEAVEQVARLSERAVQIAVLLADLTDLADQPSDAGLAEMLDGLAAAVDAAVEQFGVQDGTADAVTESAAQVHRLRDPEIEPAHVRTTCRITIADALDDLRARPGR